MGKGKVTAKGNSKTVTLDRIVKYLLSISPRPATPGEIAMETGVDKKQCKVYCNRLLTRGRIGKDIRGYYRALYSLDDILKQESPELKLHGIKLEGCYQIGDSLTSLLLLPVKILGASGNREMTKLFFEGRTVTIMYSGTTGTIEIYLRSSKYPIDFITFEKFDTYLETIILDKKLYFGLNVVQLEIGRDFRTWRLDGWGKPSIKLGAWQNAWAQIYQKNQGNMRVEVRVQKVISLQDAINILNGMAAQMKPRYELQPDTKLDVA